MDTPTETCQIAEYMEAASDKKIDACSNTATDPIGLTICGVTFYFKVCSECRANLLESMKLAVAELMRKERSERYRSYNV
jgi:hypothetical protein